ncbi:MAG: transglutaminase-like domain-containing protein [Oscillospiraceae bacterium]|nr:transglutaminase-like domain-containing protein [Oscillospiraceae bacterium]
MTGTNRIRRTVMVVIAAIVVIAVVGIILSLLANQAKADKPSSLPVKQETVTGVSVSANSNASVDYSNLAEGYVLVQYTGGKSVKIKVQITKTGGTTYTYDLNNTGSVEVYPLTEGDGSYTIKVMENVSGTSYAQAHSATVTMKLRNDFLPFLYPNQYVNYTASSAVVSQAATLCADKTDDLDKLTEIYNYVVKNFSYDNALAASVQSGYLPDVDKVLAAKKGICFDYAAVMSAMLRSQNIPCKLVVGYAGTTYHAWINVYIEGTGWIDQAIYFDGINWTLMDPTFASTGRNSSAAIEYITNDSNYTEKYAY